MIVKLLGKKISYFGMLEGFCRVGKPSGRLDLMDIDNDYFLAKCDRNEDRELALNGGPWHLYDHYVAVCEWNVGFFSSSATIDKTCV